MPVLLGTEASMNVAACVNKAAQIQPAGIELTVRQVSDFVMEGTLGFDNKQRFLPETLPLRFGDDGSVYLDPGAYLIDLNEVVSIPNNQVAFAVPRSSLLRMGVTLGTALWDPGYTGHGQVLMVVHNADGFVLYKDARILQLVFMTLTDVPRELYNGIFQGR